MDGNSSWKDLIVSDRPWLVVLLTMSSSHLELFLPLTLQPWFYKCAASFTSYFTRDFSRET